MTAKNKDILYTVAFSQDGNLDKACSAERHAAFSCPSCKSPMILRRSGLQGPRRKRPHFAHKNLIPNCSAESNLHFAFKTMAFQILKSKLAEGDDFSFSWDCNYCMGGHEGNFLKVAKNVQLERVVGSYIPDLSLLDKDGRVIFVIEIVVTHSPEQSALGYYSQNNINVIQYDIKSEDDLVNVEKRLAVPDIVDVCRNPKCRICGGHQGERRLMIIDTSCYGCKSPVKVAIGIGAPNSSGLYNGASEHGPVYSPREFSAKEVRLAREHGVNIRKAYKGTIENDNACHCPKCHLWWGPSYLYELAREARQGGLPHEYRHMGYECAHHDCESQA